MRPLQQSGSLKILKTCSVKMLKTCSVKNIKSCVPQQRVCYNWHLKELPFFNTSNILEENIATTSEIIQSDGHSDALGAHKNHLINIHLNKQSTSATFDEFHLMFYQHPSDINLSKTWLQNDRNLVQSVQIQGYNFCFRNQDKRRGGGVGLNIKDTIKYKERQEFSKLDETIEYMSTKCQGKNKN